MVSASIDQRAFGGQLPWLNFLDVTMTLTRVTLVHEQQRVLAMLDLATCDIGRVFRNRFKCKRPTHLWTETGQLFEPRLHDHTPVTLFACPQPTVEPSPAGETRHIFRKSEVDRHAILQLGAVAYLPGVSVVVGLPDLHPGNQFPVGCVVACENTIYPELVGNDIGCGMALFTCPFRASADGLFRAFRNWTSPPGPDGMGTIGGGNHFAEVMECTSGRWAGDRLLLVHSGSRAVGAAVLKPDGAVAPSSPEGREYLTAHDHALGWARQNRRKIAESILGSEPETLLDICHNSLTFERGRWLHRKGAAPSNRGLVVIPGSRGSPSYVVRGKGSGDYNLDSLAHGAGRCMSRSKARLNNERKGWDFTRTAIGSRVWSASQQHLHEETPDAYKDIETVIDDLAEYCDVVAVLKPVLTLKA